MQLANTASFCSYKPQFFHVSSKVVSRKAYGIRIASSATENVNCENDPAKIRPGLTSRLQPARTTVIESAMAACLNPNNLKRIALCLTISMCLFIICPFAQAADVATKSSSAFSTFLSYILHLDHHLGALIARHGPTTYAILFAIVFCETGLVLTPFLPGDSLLFATGAFAGMGSLDFGILCSVFVVSAILGDALNYAVGRRLGRWALDRNIVSRQHIAKTEEFYNKYGGKTVVLARFVPIVRTFAPFVAGIGSMPYGRFALYNVVGALVWTGLFVTAGYFFGNLPFVRKNFTLVVLAIVVISVLPILIELWAARKGGNSGKEPEIKAAKP